MRLLPRATTGRALLCGGVSAALLVGSAAGTAGAHPAPDRTGAGTGVQLEWLDRGLVAAATDRGVFLSWRLLGHEVTGATVSGETGPGFRVYRDGALVTTVTGSTNWLDTAGGEGSRYRVVPVVDGREAGPVGEATPWGGASLDVALRKPAGGTTPAGEQYTYSANDVSAADVDGDGQLELVVKWDPSNSKDVSQVGYTGNAYLDTYELDGTLLARVDLGVNIRAGAHYTQFLVQDFDGDGRAELMLKTAPGTSSTRYVDGEAAGTRPITLLPEDVAAGVTHADDYRLSAAQYREHFIGVLRGWHAHPEVVAGRWPVTVEEALGLEPRYSYPLSQADAAALADHFIDVYAPARSSRNALRAFEGFILTGPEYLTVFDAGTGEELQTVAYEPGRTDDGLMWGDYAMSRIEPGNRVDRFLAGVAHLDGERPSAVFARGYYTRATLVAYDWDGERLTRRWSVDSGFAPMTNPFDDSPHGRDGTDPVYGTLTTQGFHSLSAADVDGDGRHEVVYGSATIDDDGSLLYSSFDTMPEGSADPGASARLGHGDAMHVTDIDPDRPGLEIFTVHEGGTWAPYGNALRDAATGETIFGTYSGRDTGRGMIGDVDPGTRGIEVWASMPNGTDGSGLLSARGEQLATTTPGTNQSIRWAADGTTQIVEGSGDATPVVVDRDHGVLLTATGTRTDNGTKGNPALVADVLGDWREELVLRTTDSTALRIFLSTEVTDRAVRTLMHDAQYRDEVARQQTGYNQPTHPGFYLASDTDFTQVPAPDVLAPTPEVLGARLAELSAAGEVTGPVVKVLRAHARNAQRHLERGRAEQAGRELHRFLDRLEQRPGSSRVGEHAERVLRYTATSALTALG
ncbi:rhamnogalacturonan lyase [Paenibacillus sp. TRM 82003]|uniref:rhamnogalacturonan lyase n=1 Tax=Kineococcus sp. TRM81007 TaxID=2925831 RepID=UPI001F5A3920|nr:rhamnogalacturonan lyase [Kineococcus sp. TRM81007]MCI2239058.1 rhamnogalacturonan lyase [Kineococcus sp. TRM81007]MCI3924478.1 rhamnogalacturonan lyase [Paenibacillus sp. TRM 82003]